MRKSFYFLTAFLLLSPLLCLAGSGRGERHGGRQGGGERGRSRDQKGPPGPSVFLTDVPEEPGSVILGRPEATSVTLSFLWQKGAETVLVWAGAAEKLPSQGRKVSLTPGEPLRVVISGLAPNTAYSYALLDASTKKRLLPADGNGSFHTARAPGSAFTFTVQADAHLDGSCSAELYKRTLLNVLAEAPDFHIDLGDTFMTEKHASRESAAKQYAAQRYYFGLIGYRVPLFLVLGNHDGENLDRSGRTEAGGLADWSHGMRARYFANPSPDGFYTGNGTRHAAAGLPENYYAWTWGDALFVALDPYRTSLPTRGGSEPWNMTLGKAQYDWLAKTLRGSKAKFKFIFIHQLVGGSGNGGRGGSEAAALYEWGGHEPDGEYDFAENRPGWEKPIHKLLVEAGVNLVFHGHDHFFARQELDGVVYQLVPQPAHRDAVRQQAVEYGYKKGDFLPNSGHLRVRVRPSGAEVTYIRSAEQKLEGEGITNGEDEFSYTITIVKGQR